MKRKDLDKMIEKAKVGFSLPPEVTFNKTMLPSGVWAYVFRHSTLGELGRLVLLPHGDQTQFSCEVAGDPNDPMTNKRREILEPITKDMLERVGDIFGSGTGKPKPYTPQKDNVVIKSSLMPCEKCGKPAAMMIIAPDAFSAGDLADYARLMHTKVQELNVPTWVVGAEKEIIKNGEPMGEALVLKIWPEHEDAKVILSPEFNAMLDVCMTTHCK